MKEVYLFALLVVSCCLGYTTYILTTNSWSSTNMARAYEMGCLYGKAPLTDFKVFQCIKSTGVFRTTLIYSEEIN